MSDPADAVEKVQEQAAEEIQADALECLIEAGRLEATLDILQSIVSEAVLHIGSHGLQTRVVDPANVCMLDIELGADAFADTGSGSFALGINLERLQDYLSKADDETLVSLSFDTQTRKLRVQYGAVDATVACIDPESIRAEPDIPDLELPNTLVTELSDLEDGVDVADMASDRLTIVGDPDREVVDIVAEGDTDDITWTFDDERALPGTVVSEEASAIFSIAYLTGASGSSTKGVLTQIPANPEIELRFGNDFPTMYEFEFADGDGEVLVMQAPRIQSD